MRDFLVGRRRDRASKKHREDWLTFWLEEGIRGTRGKEGDRVGEWGKEGAEWTPMLIDECGCY